MSETRQVDTDTKPVLFSLLRGDPLFRVQKLLGLVSDDRLHVGRRAILYAALCWVPLIVWYVLSGAALPQSPNETLLRHYGIHIRCLIAIPLLIFAEAAAEGVFARVIPQLELTGIVSGPSRDRFRELLADATRLRDNWLPWVVIVGTPALVGWFRVAGWVDTDPMNWEDAWAGLGSGFGYYWYSVVVIPLSLILLLAWIWRVVVVAVLFHRMGKLSLGLVPTHPDRMGGLGFLEWVPSAFSPVILAITSVIAGDVGHQVLYHGTTLDSLKLQAAVLMALFLVVFLSPLLLLSGPLRRLARSGELEYARLAGRMGHLIDRKWIHQEAVAPDPVLASPELGPMVDLSSIYEAASSVRSVPIGKRALIAVLVPAAVPMLCVVLLKVPIAEILLKIAKGLA